MIEIVDSVLLTGNWGNARRSQLSHNRRTVAAHHLGDLGLDRGGHRDRDQKDWQPSMIVAFIVVAVIVVGGVTVLRFRSGGPGPAVNWVPRSLRGRMNKSYKADGWQEPYDYEGNRSQDRDSI